MFTLDELIESGRKGTQQAVEATLAANRQVSGRNAHGNLVRATRIRGQWVGRQIWQDGQW